MKKVLFLSVVALAIFASCSKKIDAPKHETLDFSTDQFIKGGITTAMVANLQKNSLIASGSSSEIYVGSITKDFVARVGYRNADGSTYEKTGLLRGGTPVVVVDGRISVSDGGNPVYWIEDVLWEPCLGRCSEPYIAFVTPAYMQ